VPLFARDRQVVGAMSIAAVSYRVDVETLRGWWPVLRSHAEQLNAELIPYFDRYI
jgi:DNA-binding IclR family transcriptional regulator